MYVSVTSAYVAHVGLTQLTKTYDDKNCSELHQIM